VNGRTGGYIFLLVGLLGVGLVIQPVGAVDAPPTADDTARIDAALAEPNGTQTVIVRLSERSPGTVQATTQANQVAAMKAHATDTQAAFEQFAEGNPHVEIDREFWITNALVVTVDTDQVPLRRVGQVDNVELIHDNFNVSATTTATQRSQPTAMPQLTPASDSYTWGLNRIGVPKTWNQFDNRGDGVTIAVLDTGVDPDHPDITVANWTDTSNDPTPTPIDYGTHGTHVTGTIAGGDASGTYIGVAPNATIDAAAVLTECGDGPGSCSGSADQIIEGIEWAVENDADIVSMSLGATGYGDVFIDPIQNAQAAGTTPVVAIGNRGSGTSGSPGNVYESLSVGASTDTGTVASFSGGETVSDDDWSDPPTEWPSPYVVPDIVAPGTDITSSVAGGSYAQLDGTSMATPHVSGTLALMISNGDSDPTQTQARSRLESTAVNLGLDADRQGAGRIDAYAATMKHSRETLSPTLTPKKTNVSVPTEIAVEANHPIDQYYWTFENKKTVTTTTPTLKQTFEAKSSETVSLTLEDATGENITTSSQIDIVDEIQPTLNLTTNRSDAVEIGIDTIEFNASQSTDNDEISQYDWTFDDGETTTTDSPTVAHTYDTLGDLTPMVTVSDASGNTNTTSRNITVVDTTAPTPEITAPESVVTRSSITLSATNSTDNDEIATYSWTFDNGTTKTGSDSSHTFDEAGTETVTLAVTDRSGNTASTTTDITVQSAPSVSVTSPSEGSYVSSATPQIEYTLSTTDADGVSAVEYRLVTEPTGQQVVGWTEGNFTATDSPVSHAVTAESVADGNYTTEFRLVDTAGEPLAPDSATDNTSFAVKSTPPTVELDTGPTTAGFDQYGPNNPVVINVTVADPLSVDTTVSIRDTEGTTVTDWNRSTETGNGERTTVYWNGTDPTGTLVASDSYEVNLTADDGVGNTNQRSENITVDTDTPTVGVQSIDGGQTHDGTVFLNDSTTADITVTADDGPEATGELQDVTLSAESSAANYQLRPSLDTTSETTRAATLTGSDIDDPGEYSLIATATDTANNTGVSDGTNIEYDPNPPQLSAVVTDVDPTAEIGTVRVRSTESLGGSPTVVVTAPNSSEANVGLDKNGGRWTGEFAITDSGQYSLSATGTDRAGNRGSDTATTTVDSNVSTTNRTTTVYSQSTGLFIRINTTDEVDSETVALTETAISPEALDPERVGVQFLEGELSDTLGSSLANATIGIPVDTETLPDGVSADDEQVAISYYNASGIWERQPTTVERVDAFDGDYWTTTVDSFSSYGVTITDTEPPELTDVSATAADDGESVTITTEYTDKLSEINRSAISLVIDGTDQTARQSTSIRSSQTTRDDYPAGDGTYAVSVTLEDTAGNAATYDRSVSADMNEDTDSDDGSSDNSDSGGGGGAGSSGGSGAPPDTGDDDPPTVQQVRDTLQLAEPAATTQTEVADDDPDTAGTQVTPEDTESVQEISFDKEGLSGNVDITEYSSPPETIREDVAESVTAAGAVDTSGDSGTGGSVNIVSITDITPDNEAAEDSAATVTLSVPASEVTNPKRVTVVKGTYDFDAQEETWSELKTTLEEAGEEEVTVSARAESFSLFAVAEVEPADDGPAAGDGTDAQDDGQDEEPADDGGPSTALLVVGLLVVLAAIGAFLYSRQE